jgi:hypothetical protein
MEIHGPNEAQVMGRRTRRVHLKLELPTGYIFIPNQHHYLNLGSSDESVVYVPPFELPDLEFDWLIPVQVIREGEVVLHLEGQVFFCPVDDNTICIFASIDEEWPVEVAEGGEGPVELIHLIEVLYELDGAFMPLHLAHVGEK